MLEAFQAAGAKNILSEVVVRATNVFHSESIALRWLTSPILSLGNVSPLEYMKNENGEEEVLRVLVRIEHGVTG